MVLWKGDVASSSEDEYVSDTPSSSFKEWKLEFAGNLNAIETFGDFACMTCRSAFTNPGLQVDDALIPLPLLPRDAETIKAKCEQAPRGDDTLIDVSVRNTWRLDASQFRCSNPAW